AAATNLANQGFPVHLFEREKTLGGNLRNINKVFPENIPAEELLESLTENVYKNSRIKLHMPAEKKNIAGYVGNFDVTILEKESGKETTVRVGTIIVATGAKPFKPTGLYGYGEVEGVLTQLDLERELRKGINKKEWRNVVMINCVGARTPERPYCSRICCMITIKNASLLREANPETKVYVLHRDIMAQGVEFEEYFRRSMELGVRYIRYSPEKPPEIIQEDNKLRGVRVHHEPMGREVELPADHLVLATPLVPQPDSGEVAKMLKVPLEENGFFLEAHVKLRPTEFATDGVYVAGSAHWPTHIGECISQGYAAAAKAAIPMRRGYIVSEAITATINEEACTGCGACVASCPYTAITLIEKGGQRKASVNVAQCKGCGTCVASCANGAIQQEGYTDNQLLSMIEALVGEETK
ncbi:MAG: CoB--CoM heterodisulfide reductase iron-sulfur subunit A family protein, partial [Methanobacteriota archaeon]